MVDFERQEVQPQLLESEMASYSETRSGLRSKLGEFVRSSVDWAHEGIGRKIALGSSALALAGGAVAYAQEQSPNQPITSDPNTHPTPKVLPENPPVYKDGCVAASKSAKSKVEFLNTGKPRVFEDQNYSLYEHVIRLHQANKNMNVKVSLSIPMIGYNKSVSVALKACNLIPRTISFGAMKFAGDGDPSTPRHKVPGGRQILTVMHGKSIKYVRNSAGKKVKRTVPNVIKKQAYITTVP